MKCSLLDFVTKGFVSSMKTTLPRGFLPLWPTSYASFFSLSKRPTTSARLPGFQDGSCIRSQGELKGSWSLTVTGNWRLIFRYNEDTHTASDIDLIDYH